MAGNEQAAAAAEIFKDLKAEAGTAPLDTRTEALVGIGHAILAVAHAIEEHRLEVRDAIWREPG